MENKKKLLKRLPQKIGVYIFKDNRGQVLYLGKAINIKRRVQSHFTNKNGDFFYNKTAKLVSKIERVDYTLVDSEFNALLLEAKLIKLFKPKYNVSWKDDKHFLYIKITNEEFPKVLTCRKEEGLNLYFGPFPQANTVRFVLKTLRKIFPFCSQKKIGSKPCFYCHLKLCNPCPSLIIKLKGRKFEKLKRKYRYNLSNIKKILGGKSAKVGSLLEKKMKKASASQKFEEAALLRNQIEKLNYVITQRMPISEYFKNQPLIIDLASIGLKELENLLRGMIGFKIPRLKKIECYDVSNLQGNWATGSLVTFVDGLPAKKHYRRFRVRFNKKPNDVAMISEILSRRFNHREWSFPDLIMVDGGKTQVSAAIKVLRKKRLKFPVIGLEKRNDKMIFSQLRKKIGKEKISNFQTLKLNKHSAALLVLKHLRDESHRFALKYHHLLYKKNLIN